ncbi:MAG: AMP-binding protein, partial [Myxococcales bacterium]|nr:AMP-binding protein [Myxococcales bacterium]
MASGFEHATSVIALVRHNALRFADQPAVSLVRDLDREGGTTTLTYAALDHTARAVAAWLQTRFAPGERVLLLYPVGVHFVPAFLGCVYAGMIAVPAPMPG